MTASVGSRPTSSGGERSDPHALERVAQLAAYTFGVPASLVQIGGISAHAMPGPGEPALSADDLLGLSRQLAPVGAPVVVEDVTEDDRIAAEGTLARFAAAAPILDMRKQRIGALYLADVAPRTFSETEVEHVRTLATLAGALRTPLEGVARGPSLERIVQQAGHGIVVTDADERITWANEGFTRLCGYTVEELRGRKPGDVLQGPQTDPNVVATMRERLQAEEAFTAELVNYRKSGEPYWVHIQAEPVTDESGALAGFVAFETDVSERKVREERLLQVSDAEQRRLGSELYELVASQLLGTGVMASGLEQRREREEDVTSRDLHVLVEHIQEAVRRIRVLAYTLVPDRLREEDFGAALRRLAASKAELRGIPYSVDIEPGLPPMDEDSAMHLFRIAGEAIDNALTYAAPDHVWVRLARQAGRVVLTVRDDGVGASEAVARGLERSTMRYRAGFIGAELSVLHAERGGTIVRCELPVG